MRPFLNFTFALIAAGILLTSVNKPLALEKADNKAQEIVFIENSWKEALKQAKLQNKLLFVDAYASWCGPCKMLKLSTFHNAKAAAFYNANFVNVSIDMEKGDGPFLASDWQIQAYPTLIVFDPDGKPILGTVGFISAKDLIRFGNAALAKVDRKPLWGGRKLSGVKFLN